VANRLFNLATAVSAVVLCLVVVAWFAASAVDPRKQFVSLSGSCHLSLDARGADARLQVFNDSNHGPYGGSIIAVSGAGGSSNDPQVSGVGDVAGIYYRMIRWQDGTSLSTLSLSLAYPLLLAALLPFVWLVRRSRRRSPNAESATAGSHARRLRWQSQWGFQTAADGSCYYIRESGGSMIAGGVFATVFAVGGLGYGGHLLMTDATAGGRVFACLCLLVGAGFACVLVSCVWNGRWMIVYDRGGPSAPAEIRFRKKRLSADRIRSISTRHSGGSAGNPQRIVVAELHDGTFEILGPSGVSTWPDHWGQQAATWMGLPFRQSNS
jgi:hypothetical protein